MAQNMRDIAFGSVNLYNLQLPGAQMHPGSHPYTQEQYADKIAWTIQTIERLDADVIAFQELWSRQCLEDVFAAPVFGDTYKLAFITPDDWDGIAVACAVREPWEIRNTIRHKAFPEGFVLKKRGRRMRDINANPNDADLEDDAAMLPSHEDDDIEVRVEQFSRSVLQVTIGHARAAEAPAIEVFCCHLKSKLPTRLDKDEFDNPAVRPHQTALGAAISTIRRTAEAAALRVILNQTMVDNDAPTVVLGDLNDGQLSNTLGILTDQPSYRFYADSTAAGRNDDGLYTVATLQQLRSLRDVYYTHEFKGVKEILDHALVSEQFYDHSQRRKWSFRDMRVWNDHVEDDDPASSDHGVICSYFDWKPA